jgi:pyruvate dehydrogenase E2 component (dihydrolipoamide acetyltransferase)
MALEVVVPEVGEAGMDVRFVGWLKQEGEQVRAGDALFELDTDKSTMEVEAFADGTLADLRVEADEIVRPRQVIALLLAEGEALPHPRPEAPSGDGAPEPGAAVEPRRPSGPAWETAGVAHVRAMPRARTLAAERGIDLAGIGGTGPGGVVTVDDVEAHVVGVEDADDRRLRVRRAVAEMTSRSWREVPHFHLGLDADVTSALRRLRPTVAICLALVKALERHPECNLEWRDGHAVRRAGVDLGLLVDTPAGLILPAIRGAEALGAEELRVAIASAAERARGGTLRADDQGRRSASVSNLGMFAVDAFAGVIATPDVLLLGMGRVRRVAVWSDGDWQPRDVVTLTLSVDHRALDGADGGRLLSTLETLLADPGLGT